MRLTSPVRLSLFYIAIFAVFGVQLPYWPLYLSFRGLTPTEIGQVLAGGCLVRLLSNPLAGHLADRWGAPRRPIVALAVVCLVVTALFPLGSGFTGLLVLTLVSAAAFAALLPLADSLTMQTVASERADYGRIRLWGSLSFIAVAGLAGVVLVDAPPPAVLWSAVATLVLTVGAGLTLPTAATGRSAGPTPPLRPLLADPAFLLFLGATSLTQGSHMIYYGFATLHWQQAGLAGGAIGALWAEGVVAEVVLFAFGTRLIRWTGPRVLLSLAAGAAVLRWTVLAGTTAFLPLALVQPLHALTFAAGHLGAMHFIQRTAPPGLSARAQALYSSLTSGLASGVAMLFAGRLYEAFAGNAFLVMSALAAAGLALSLLLLRRHR
jgi:PPP family 3-phenylpropionic acid transporter